MFQFPAFAPACRRCQAFSLTGCPIRNPPDHYLFAVPRRFSQLTTSFFASRSLGILRPPLFPSSRLLAPRFYGPGPFRSRCPFPLGTVKLSYSDLFFFYLVICFQYCQTTFCFFQHPIFSNGLQRYGLFDYFQIFFVKIFSFFALYPEFRQNQA